MNHITDSRLTQASHDRFRTILADPPWDVHQRAGEVPGDTIR